MGSDKEDEDYPLLDGTKKTERYNFRGVRVKWVSIKRPRLHIKRDLFYVHRNGVYYFPASLSRSETVVNGD